MGPAAARRGAAARVARRARLPAAAPHLGAGVLERFVKEAVRLDAPVTSATCAFAEEQGQRRPAEVQVRLGEDERPARPRRVRRGGGKRGRNAYENRRQHVVVNEEVIGGWPHLCFHLWHVRWLQRVDRAVGLLVGQRTLPASKARMR